MSTPIRERNFSPEFVFKTSRSSGAGGQHVNKVNTKVELRFDLCNSQILSQEEIERLKTKLASKLTQEFILIITDQSTRSQLRNKENAIERFYETLETGLKVKKLRKRKKISRAAIEKRLKAKKLQSDKKKTRRIRFDR